MGVLGSKAEDALLRDLGSCRLARQLRSDILTLEKHPPEKHQAQCPCLSAMHAARDAGTRKACRTDARWSRGWL